MTREAFAFFFIAIVGIVGVFFHPAIGIVLALAALGAVIVANLEMNKTSNRDE